MLQASRSVETPLYQGFPSLRIGDQLSRLDLDEWMVQEPLSFEQRLSVVVRGCFSMQQGATLSLSRGMHVTAKKVNCSAGQLLSRGPVELEAMGRAYFKHGRILVPDHTLTIKTTEKLRARDVAWQGSEIQLVAPSQGVHIYDSQLLGTLTASDCAEFHATGVRISGHDTQTLVLGAEGIGELRLIETVISGFQRAEFLGASAHFKESTIDLETELFTRAKQLSWEGLLLVVRKGDAKLRGHTGLVTRVALITQGEQSIRFKELRGDLLELRADGDVNVFGQRKVNLVDSLFVSERGSVKAKSAAELGLPHSTLRGRVSVSAAAPRGNLLEGVLASKGEITVKFPKKLDAQSSSWIAPSIKGEGAAVNLTRSQHSSPNGRWKTSQLKSSEAQFRGGDWELTGDDLNLALSTIKPRSMKLTARLVANLTAALVSGKLVADGGKKLLAAKLKAQGETLTVSGTKLVWLPCAEIETAQAVEASSHRVTLIASELQAGRLLVQNSGDVDLEGTELTLLSGQSTVAAERVNSSEHTAVRGAGDLAVESEKPHIQLGTTDMEGHLKLSAPGVSLVGRTKVGEVTVEGGDYVGNDAPLEVARKAVIHAKKIRNDASMHSDGNLRLHQEAYGKTGDVTANGVLSIWTDEALHPTDDIDVAGGLELRSLTGGILLGHDVHAGGCGILRSPDAVFFDHMKLSFGGGIDLQAKGFDSHVSTFDITAGETPSVINCEDFALRCTVVPRGNSAERWDVDSSNFRHSGTLAFRATASCLNDGSEFLIDGDLVWAGAALQNQNRSHVYSYQVQTGTAKKRKYGGLKKKKRPTYAYRSEIITDAVANTQVKRSLTIDDWEGTFRNDGIFFAGSLTGNAEAVFNGIASNAGSTPSSVLDIPTLFPERTPRPGGDFHVMGDLSLTLSQDFRNRGFFTSGGLFDLQADKKINERRVTEQQIDGVIMGGWRSDKVRRVTTDFLNPGGVMGGGDTRIRCRRGYNNGILEGASKQVLYAENYTIEAVALRSFNPLKYKRSRFKRCRTFSVRTDFAKAGAHSGGVLIWDVNKHLQNNGSDIVGFEDTSVKAGSYAQRTLFSSYTSFVQRSTTRSRTQHSIVMVEPSVQSVTGNTTLEARDSDADIDGLVSAALNVHIKAKRDIGLHARTMSVENKEKRISCSPTSVSIVKTKRNTTKTSLPRVQAGQKVTLEAERDISSEGLQLVAGEDCDIVFGRQLIDKGHKVQRYEKCKGVSIGVSCFGSSFVEALADKSRRSTAIQALASEHPAVGAAFDLARSEGGEAMAVQALTSAVTMWNKAAGLLDDQTLGQQLGLQDSAGKFSPTITIRISGFKDERRWTETLLSRFMIGNNLKVDGPEHEFHGTQVHVAKDVTLNGKNLLCESETDSSKHKSSSAGVSVGVGAKGLVSVGADASMSRASSTVHYRFRLDAGGRVSIDMEETAKFKGTLVEGEHLDVSAKRIIKEDVQDSHQQKSASASLSSSGACSVGYSKSKSKEAKKSELIGRSSARISGDEYTEIHKASSTSQHGMKLQSAPFMEAYDRLNREEPPRPQHKPEWLANLEDEIPRPDRKPETIAAMEVPPAPARKPTVVEGPSPSMEMIPETRSEASAQEPEASLLEERKREVARLTPFTRIGSGFDPLLSLAFQNAPLPSSLLEGLSQLEQEELKSYHRRLQFGEDIKQGAPVLRAAAATAETVDCVLGEVFRIAIEGAIRDYQRFRASSDRAQRICEVLEDAGASAKQELSELGKQIWEEVKSVTPDAAKDYVAEKWNDLQNSPERLNAAADELYTQYGVPRETTLQAAKDTCTVTEFMAVTALGAGVGKAASAGKRALTRGDWSVKKFIADESGKLSLGIAKKRDVEKQLSKYGWRYLRAGGAHDIWTNGKINTPVPRHRHLKPGTARNILKTAMENPGRGATTSKVKQFLKDESGKLSMPPSGKDRGASHKPSTLSSRTQSLMDGEPGFNFTPFTTGKKYTSIRSGGKGGTFVTDRAQIERAIGPLPEQGTRMELTADKIRELEVVLGLPEGSAGRGGTLSVIDNVAARVPRCPVAGNDLFCGGGKGLPHSGPELEIAPISTSGGGGVRKIDIFVKGSTPYAKKTAIK